MKYNLLNVFKNILYILSSNEKLIFKDTQLFDYSDTEISTPVGNILPLLLKYKSKLPDQPVNFELLKQLTDGLHADQAIVRLNHVGFCYKVDSQDNEKKRLIGQVKQTKFHIYQEKSNDDGLWLFIGDTNKWEEPMIELLPIERTNDTWVDYWLPHIQIDIDTILTAGEIKSRAYSVYNQTIRPNPITIDGIVYIVRNYLGVIDGVNIYLDLATHSRNVKFGRKNLLTRVD